MRPKFTQQCLNDDNVFTKEAENDLHYSLVKWKQSNTISTYSEDKFPLSSTIKSYMFILRSNQQAISYKNTVCK